MSQVFDIMRHRFLKGLFPGNAFTAQPVKAKEGHLRQMEWSEP
jgi:hypothetical protein